jgi:hypothetical protein
MSAIDPRLARWILWLAPFAVLAALIGLQTGWGREWRRPPVVEAPVAPAPVLTAVVPEFRIDGVDAMKATVDRPLFNASRRPAPAAPTEATAKPTIQRGQFLLTGTMITSEGAVAYLKESSGTGKAKTVKRGESINGMLVAEVTPDKVTLTVGDESEDLELKVAKGPKTTVQPTAAAPATPGAAQAAQPAGAPAAPPGGAAPTRRPQTQATSGPSDDARVNTRAARRAAREQEAAQQNGAAAGQPPGAAPNAAPQTPAQGSWQDTYQRMQRRPR